MPNENLNQYLRNQQKFMTPATNLHNKPLRNGYQHDIDLDSILNNDVKIIDKNKLV